MYLYPNTYSCYDLSKPVQYGICDKKHSNEKEEERRKVAVTQSLDAG